MLLKFSVDLTCIDSAEVIRRTQRGLVISSRVVTRSRPASLPVYIKPNEHFKTRMILRAINVKRYCDQSRTFEPVRLLRDRADKQTSSVHVLKQGSAQRLDLRRRKDEHIGKLSGTALQNLDKYQPTHILVSQCYSTKFATSALAPGGLSGCLGTHSCHLV